jgi:antitoxin ParD1/3/4
MTGVDNSYRMDYVRGRPFRRSTMASSVQLGEKLESVVDDLVRTGRYNSRSEVLREGVRLVHEREAKLQNLFALIDAGLEDSFAGRVQDIDIVEAEILAEIETWKRDEAA